MKTPLAQSYWVREGVLCGGQYPGDKKPTLRDEKLRGLIDCGIRVVVNLMEPTERDPGGQLFEPYDLRMQELVTGQDDPIEFHRHPIRDAFVPTRATMRIILDTLDTFVSRAIPTYFHCWGGHGRTGTVAACYLIRQGRTPDEAVAQVGMWRKKLPRSHDPFEGRQLAFIQSWTADA